MRRMRKILKVKEIQGFFEVCFRYDKKFSRPPRYDRCVVHRRSRYIPPCIKAACAVYAGFHVNVAFLLRGAELPLPYCITKCGKCQVFFGRSGKKGR